MGKMHNKMIKCEKRNCMMPTVIMADRNSFTRFFRFMDKLVNSPRRFLVQSNDEKPFLQIKANKTEKRRRLLQILQ